MNLTPREKAFTHGVLAFASALAVFPVLWVLSTSLKAEADIYRPGAGGLVPTRPTIEAYRQVLTVNNGAFITWFRNSLVVAGATAVIGTFLSAGAAFAFSRYKFVGKGALGFFFLLTQMFPGAVLLVPLYFLLQRMGLLGTFSGLIAAYATTSLPFGVWMLKGYFDTIPTTLDEAATVDGLGPFGVFWRIVAPLALPGIAVTGFFAFLTAWNEYMFALAFMTGDDKLLLPVGMAAAFGDQYQTKWHLMAAGSMMTTAPVLLVFVLCQRWLIGGLTAGGVKE